MQSRSTKEAWDVLKTLEDVHILIHRSPDGDCIGSGFALHFLLQSTGIRSCVCCGDPLPAMYHMLTDGVTFENFAPKALVSVDVADRGMLGGLQEVYGEDCRIVFCIDHHVSNTDYAEASLWNPDASAACEVIYSMMRENQLAMNEQIARCLYVGMATDTGCFKFSNAGAVTFAAVADIKQQYPELPYARMNRELFDLKSRGRIQMDARLMEQVRLSADGRVALIYMPYAWMAELDVTKDEIDGVANLPMQIQGVEVAITVKQQEDGSYRVSMRAGDHADVSAICQQFGGGGHVKAGGCSLTAELAPDAACQTLMDAASASLCQC